MPVAIAYPGENTPIVEGLTNPNEPFIIPTAVSAGPVPEGADLDYPALYFNRELSWVDFNW